MKQILYQKTSQTDAKAPREAFKLQRILKTLTIPFCKPIMDGLDLDPHTYLIELGSERLEEISNLEICDGEGEKGRVSADSCRSCAPSQGDGEGQQPAGVISNLEICDGEGEKGRVSADSCSSCTPSQGDGDGDSRGDI
jgi:hypothetical protein